MDPIPCSRTGMSSTHLCSRLPTAALSFLLGKFLLSDNAMFIALSVRHCRLGYCESEYAWFLLDASTSEPGVEPEQVRRSDNCEMPALKWQ